MTDPERLLSGGTLFERSLLAPALADKPSAALLARMEQGLGLAPAATAGAAATAASAAASASAVTSKSVLAVLGSAAAGGLAIWGVVALNSPAPVIPSQAHARSVAVEVALPNAKAEAEPDRAKGSSAALPVPAHAEVADLPLVDAEEGGASASTVRRSRSTATNDVSRVNAGPLPAKGDQLKQEVQQLDRVRAALGNGDRARALELLDAYDRRFPSGTLAPEATKLRQSARR